MIMWSRLLELFGRGYADRTRADAARRALEARYPDLAAKDVWLRARESDRDVVAVLYDDRRWRIAPRGRPPYKLFAVLRDDTVEELPVAAGDRYAIRGIK
jgi:hypothetical protein